jgi:hypothetical protein
VFWALCDKLARANRWPVGRGSAPVQPRGTAAPRYWSTGSTRPWGGLAMGWGRPGLRWTLARQGSTIRKPGRPASGGEAKVDPARFTKTRVTRSRPTLEPLFDWGRGLGHRRRLRTDGTPVVHRCECPKAPPGHGLPPRCARPAGAFDRSPWCRESLAVARPTLASAKVKSRRSGSTRVPLVGASNGQRRPGTPQWGTCGAAPFRRHLGRCRVNARSKPRRVCRRPQGPQRLRVLSVWVVPS